MRKGSEREQAFDKVLSQPEFPVALPRKIEGANDPWAFINVGFGYMKSYRHKFSDFPCS